MDFQVHIDKQVGGELIISANATTVPELLHNAQEYVLTIDNLSGLKSFKTFNDTLEGITETRLIERSYAIAKSDDPTKWSDWIKFEEGDDICLPDISPFHSYDIKLRWTRKGNSTTGKIAIKDFKIEGTWDRQETIVPTFSIKNDGEEVIYRAPFTYKVFKINDFELIAKNDDVGLNIQYRFSQNSGRSWSDWEDLSTENISTADVNPIRFFWIEYKFTRTGEFEKTSKTIDIQDLNLIGDFINVTEDYQKTNLLGIREGCSSNLTEEELCVTGGEDYTFGENCDIESLFKPYQLKRAINLYNKMSNDVNQIFGWEVKYFKTDPNSNGIDNTFHEYQLYDVVQSCDMKIIVPNNQFPDGTMQFNQFDLALFESFEVHIAKDTFKAAFGVEKRPSKEDFLWLCDISRMYKVDHSQAVRDFALSQTYYKLILSKYNQKASVRPLGSEMQSEVNDIIENSTLEDLFGDKKKKDKLDVANKKQHDTLSKDRVRETVNAKVVRELVDNAELVISKYHYSLTPDLEVAVSYKDIDKILKRSDNRSFYCWFNFPDYIDGDNYNLLTNYDEENKKGYKINIIDSKIVVTTNEKTYSMDVELSDSTWMCYLLSINQRQKRIHQYLFKRDVDREIDAGRPENSTKLRKLYDKGEDLELFNFELEDTVMHIKGSDMKLTNLRLFNDIISDDVNVMNKVLNQNIIRDSSYLIMADNANVGYNFLDNYPLNEHPV